MIIHPLAQAAIFALVLSEVLAAKLPGMPGDKLGYVIYLLSGLLCWSLFAELVSRCLTLFIDNGNLLKKIVFPRICLPLILAGSALINNILLFVAILIVLGALGHYPGILILWFPVLILTTLAFGIGLGLLLGVVNVFMRDIGQVVPVVLQLGFWLTPIVYSPNIVPESLRNWMILNPMYWLVQGYQNIFLYDSSPSFQELGWIVMGEMVLLLLALALFRRASPEMVDVL